LEAAQVALGHERADITQVYAEKIWPSQRKLQLRSDRIFPRAGSYTGPDRLKQPDFQTAISDPGLGSVDVLPTPESRTREALEAVSDISRPQQNTGSLQKPMQENYNININDDKLSLGPPSTAATSPEPDLIQVVCQRAFEHNTSQSANIVPPCYLDVLRQIEELPKDERMRLFVELEGKGLGAVRVDSLAHLRRICEEMRRLSAIAIEVRKSLSAQIQEIKTRQSRKPGRKKNIDRVYLLACAKLCIEDAGLKYRDILSELNKQAKKKGLAGYKDGNDLRSQVSKELKSNPTFLTCLDELRQECKDIIKQLKK
jgi:hypothetical protein